jgi:hypothetical protein
MLSPGPQTGSVVTLDGHVVAERDANGSLTLNGMLWQLGQGQSVIYNGTVYSDVGTLTAAVNKVGAVADFQMSDLSIGSAVAALQQAIAFVDVQAAKVALSTNTAAATALAARRALLASMVSQLQGYVAADS